MEKSGWVSIQPLSHSREDGERLKPPPATEPGSVPLSNVISCFPVGLKPNSSLQDLSVLFIPLIFSRTGALVLPRWSFLLHPSVILIVWATLRFRTPSLNRKPPVYSTWGGHQQKTPKVPVNVSFRRVQDLPPRPGRSASRFEQRLSGKFFLYIFLI